MGQWLGFQSRLGTLCLVGVMSVAPLEMEEPQKKKTIIPYGYCLFVFVKLLCVVGICFLFLFEDRQVKPLGLSYSSEEPTVCIGYSPPQRFHALLSDTIYIPLGNQTEVNIDPFFPCEYSGLNELNISNVDAEYMEFIVNYQIPRANLQILTFNAVPAESSAFIKNIHMDTLKTVIFDDMHNASDISVFLASNKVSLLIFRDCTISDDIIHSLVLSDPVSLRFQGGSPDPTQLIKALWTSGQRLRHIEFTTANVQDLEVDTTGTYDLILQGADGQRTLNK